MFRRKARLKSGDLKAFGSEIWNRCASNMFGHLQTS
jgi:hypothetical protein